jgi:hypothetical protein
VFVDWITVSDGESSLFVEVLGMFLTHFESLTVKACGSSDAEVNVAAKKTARTTRNFHIVLKSFESDKELNFKPMLKSLKHST